MEFVKYYQDELTYLREMGEEFSTYYPKLAPHLAKSGTDPDVERILEAFAFISAKIRQKIDDEVPELTESLFSILWPHLLRPIPSCSILKLRPVPGTVSDKKHITKGMEVESAAVDGIKCRFRTAYDVNVYPIDISALETVEVNGKPQWCVELSAMNRVKLASMQLTSLSFYINTEAFEAEEMLYLLAEKLERLYMVDESSGRSVDLPLNMIAFRGFDTDDTLLPYPDNVDDRYRLLQEYFCFRPKFYFFDLRGLDLSLQSFPELDKVRVYFGFEKNTPLPPLATHKWQLFCTPIVNLFNKEADPIRIKSGKIEYRMRADLENDLAYDIYDVNRVSGRRQGEKRSREYRSYLFRDRYDKTDTGNAYYSIKREPAIVGPGTDTYIRFHQLDVSDETVSSELTCTNANLPARLKKGDIRFPTASTPEFLACENITVPTISYPAPFRRNMHWMLIKNMAVGKKSLLSIDTLAEVFSLYNYPSFYSLQEERFNELKKESLLSLSVTSGNFFKNGVLQKGQEIVVTVDEKKYLGRGELYLFFSVLFHLFMDVAPLNHATRLVVKEKYQGGTFEWSS